MKKNILWISLWLLSLASLQAQQTLVVNEIMASNSHSASDGSGEFEDWFEIYNASSTTINLAGYYLSDDAANPKKYKVPAGSGTTQIPAGGFLVIWASEAINRGPLHTNFKLSANGEQVIITSPDGITTVNSVTFGSQKTDVSYGRKPDGSNDWLYFVNPTAGSSNNAVAGLAELLKAPSFSQPGGFYAQNINLSISSQDQGTMIYYTLDGSEPTPDNLTAKTFTYKNQYPEGPNQGFGPLLSASYQSYVYTGPLTISDQSSSSNKLSVKSSTANYDPNFYFPTSPVFKGTVVKAKAYKANALPSETITQTFFITPNPNRYSIPVVSVSLEEKHLFDYNQGIYTAGVTFDNKRIEDPNFFATEFCTKGNFTNEGEAWERNGNVEFFSTNTTVINQPVGLRIHGGCSSSIFRKSLRLYSDSEFDYPLFTDRPSTLAHKRLILRSGGNDYKYSLLTDAFMQKMVRHLPVATQANRAAVVFLNGEYWGVHTLDERYDKYYFNKLYRVATDSLDLLTLSLGIEVDEGDHTTYDAFYNYFANNNPVNYTYVKTLMDVENFTDYYIAEIFSSNTDWPHNNQVLWRKRVTPGTPTNHYGNDGRWRWALKDMDYGLGLMNQSNHNTLATATDNGVFGGYTRYLRRLLDIDEFKVYFINRFADLLNTTFNPTRTSAMLTEMKNEYSPAMQEHFTRWPEGNTYQGWLTNVEKIRTFIQQRPDFVREHIRNKFGLPANYNLTLGVSNTEQGYIKINTIELVPSTAGVSQNPYPWTGSYFQGNPIKVTARSRVGYKFMHWKEANTIISTDSVYTIASLNSARSLEAVFASDAVIKVTPTPYALAQCDYRMESWSSSATAGTYPPHMQFVHMSTEDPTLVATVADTVLGLYNHTSRTRLNGLNENGFSFINTSVDNTNPGYIPGRLGGALLALNTQNITEAQVQWTGGTVTANTRPYRIRLRYRVGNSGDFQDLLDNQSNPIEYVRNITGHSQMIGPVALPTAILNKPYVQLLWQYYFMGTGSGARDQLRVDDIIITRGKCESVASGIWSVASTWSCGRIPTVCDAVTIRSGHTVKAQKLVTLGKSLQIENGGVLQYFEPNATLNVSTNP